MPEPSPCTVLRVRQLCFAHPQAQPLFDGWSVDLPAGLSLLDGEMGSGKTSLLRLLAGVWAGRGEIRLLGRRLGADPAADRREIVWFDPRDPAFDSLTPTDLRAELSLRHPCLDRAAWQDHVAGLGLTAHLDKPLYALSTGSRQKAGLAVALAAGGALTLLDEPAAGLDAPARAYLVSALTAFNADAAGPPPRALLMVCSQPLTGLVPTLAIHLPAPRTDR